MAFGTNVDQSAETSLVDKINSIDLNNDVSPLSSLERLPKELMWKVIECAPDAALELRKTSSTLKEQIENFAIAQSTMPLVSKLSFGAFRLPGSTKPPTQFTIDFNIDTDKADLFYLRLQLLGLTDFREEIRKMSPNPDVEPLVSKRITYDIEFDVSDEGIDKKVEKLREYLGRRIGKVGFHGCYEPVTLPTMTKVLEHTQFSQMKLVADKLPEEVALHLLHTMVTHNVKQLSMAGRFETTIDTVTLLRQLSSHLRGLQIFQTPMEPGTEINATNHLFGTDNADWGNLIVELFSGALDKLSINNPTYSKYLTESATNKLIDTLPKLEKKVHFVATCDQYEQGLDSDSHKNYSVKVNPPPAPQAAAANNQAPPKPKQYLQIKHVERAHEPVVDAFNMEVECN